MKALTKITDNYKYLVIFKVCLIFVYFPLYYKTILLMECENSRRFYIV